MQVFAATFVYQSDNQPSTWKPQDLTGACQGNKKGVGDRQEHGWNPCDHARQDIESLQ